MPEFRKLFDLPVVKLSRADITQLGRIICDGITLKPECNAFSVSHGDVIYRSSSIEDLMSQDLPNVIDSLSFAVVGWRDKELIQSVNINLQRTVSSCYISASGDEVWFRGKLQQIMDFFTQRRPWYGKIKRDWIPRIFGATDVMFLFLTGGFIAAGWFWPSAIALIVVASSSIAFRAFLKGRLFPTTAIQLCQESSALSREVLTVIFTGVMALGSVATAIIQIIQIAKP